MAAAATRVQRAGLRSASAPRGCGASRISPGPSGRVDGRTRGAKRTPPIVAAPCGPVHASGNDDGDDPRSGSNAFASFGIGSFAREFDPGAARDDTSRTSKRAAARSAAAARSTPRTGAAADGLAAPDPTVRSVPATTRAETDVVVSAEASRISAVAAEVARPADGDGDGDDIPREGNSPGDAFARRIPGDGFGRLVRDGGVSRVVDWACHATSYSAPVVVFGDVSVARGGDAATRRDDPPRILFVSSE